MTSQPENFVSGPTRRDFIKTAAQTAAVVAGADFLAPAVYAQGRARKVAIVSDPTDSLTKEQPVRWAVEQLENRLNSRGPARYCDLTFHRPRVLSHRA